MDAILGVLTIMQADTGSGGLVSLVGSNMFGGQLPEHYNPEVSSTAEPAGNGPAITLLVKGGSTHPEMPLQEVDVQVKVWAGINANFLSRSIYNRCFQVLNGLCMVPVGAAGLVKRILATVPGVDDVDPDTGWSVTLGAFNVMIMDNGQYPVFVPITPTETAAQYTDAAIAAISEIDGNGNFS